MTIAFDFDGVIHLGYEGYKDGSIYGYMNMELLNYIKTLLYKYQYNIVIYSSRDAVQIVQYMNSLQLDLKFELFDMNKNKFWNKQYVVGVTNNKPVANLYIDDRAYAYKNDSSPTLNINNIDRILFDGKNTYNKEIKINE